MPNDTDNKTSRLSVILPPDIYEKVVSMANKHDLSVAWVVRYIITDFLKNDRHILINSKDEDKNDR